MTRAANQRRAGADEAGASDGASQLIALFGSVIPPCLLAAMSLTASVAQAQTHLEKVKALRLDSLKAGSNVAYYSEGQEARARVFLTLIHDMEAFYAREKNWRLAQFVAVLSEKDWRATIENPYGVPGVRYPGPISFVPADVQRGVVYRDIVSLWDRVTPELEAEIKQVCGSIETCAADGSDAIITHELGHVYEEYAGIGRPNVWVGELVADYLSYAYLRERRPPQFKPYLLIHRLSASSPPQFNSLDEFERNVSSAVPAELGRLHAVLLERVQEVYAKQGLRFIEKVAAAFPRQERPTGCPTSGAAAGLCESQRLPQEEVLRRLEAIEPGFTAWAGTFGRTRR
jgi:hypothetical protein